MTYSKIIRCIFIAVSAPVFLLAQSCASSPIQTQCATGQYDGCSDFYEPGVVTATDRLPTPVTPSPSRLGKDFNRPNLLIATDFVNALTQLRQNKNIDSVISMPNAYSTFASALEEALVSRGFKINRTELRSGKGVMNTTVFKESTNDNHYTYIVTVDRIGLKRSYSIDNQRISPISSLLVRGVSPSLISLNDGLFTN